MSNIVLTTLMAMPVPIVKMSSLGSFIRSRDLIHSSFISSVVRYELRWNWTISSHLWSHSPSYSQACFVKSAKYTAGINQMQRHKVQIWFGRIKTLPPISHGSRLRFESHTFRYYSQSFTYFSGWFTSKWNVTWKHYKVCIKTWNNGVIRNLSLQRNKFQ